MASSEDLLPDVAHFELGVSDDDMSETYTNVGFILSTIIESKMNDNFYEFLHQLKPIDNKHINQYMKRFGHESDPALRHNEHLKLIVFFLIQDAGQLKTESETALNSVIKVEDFIRFLYRQENNGNDVMAKSVEVIVTKENEMKAEPLDMDNDSQTAVITTTDKPTAPSTARIETTVKMRVKGVSQTLGLSSALEVIKKVREEYERHSKATASLRLCMEALLAINEQNRLKIQKWRPDVKQSAKKDN